MDFYHEKCRQAPLAFDVSSVVGLLSPSYGIRGGRFLYGLTEIRLRETPRLHEIFYCRQCRKSVGIDDNIVSKCSICLEYTPIDVLVSTKELACVCPRCILLLENKGLGEIPPTDKLRDMLMFISVEKTNNKMSIKDIIITTIKNS